MTRAIQLLYSGLGGHASVSFAIVEGDVDRVWNHTLLFYGIEPVPKTYMEKCRALGAQCLAVRKRPGLDPRAVLGLAKHLASCRPDVIISHSASALPVAIAYRHVRPGVPVVFVEHQPNEIKTRAEWAASAAAMFLADRVVTLTEPHEAELRDKLGPLFSRTRVHRIPNALDLVRFSPGSPDAGEEPLTIAMQARFAPTRDHATLVQAFGACARDTGSPLKLVLAGDGTTLTAVRELVQSERLAPFVELPGMLGEDAVVALLKRTGVYVHASNHETMSTAVMQAMSCGLPCVLADIPALRALGQEGVTAVFYRPGSVPDLTLRLKQLASDRSLRTRLGDAARRYAEQNWSHKDQFARYRGLVADTRSSRSPAVAP